MRRALDQVFCQQQQENKNQNIIPQSESEDYLA